MAFFALIAIASFHWLRSTKDMQFFLSIMGFTMCWQAFVGLKMKYLGGIYQVRGTFEHQNPLAMYSVMIAMPFLAASLGPAFRGRNWCTAGFIACAILVQSALSRAALVMFAGGTVIVALVSLLEKPTTRRIGMLASLSAVGALGLLLTLDTIVSRFGDHGNTASAELRVVLNEAARQMQKDHPLGIGWNNYALCINTPYPYAEVVYDWTRGRNMTVDEEKPNAPVESHYFLLIGENGYPGLVSWVLVITAGLWRNLRAFISFPHSFERCLSLGIATGCALNYAQSAYERVLTQPRNLMLWLIIFGLTARLEILRRNPSPSPSPSPSPAPPSPNPPPPSATPTPSPWPAPAAILAPHPVPHSHPAFPPPPWAQP
jgi:hypothetical protein